MSYSSEHQRMKPILERAKRLNIENHPAPNSIFDPLNAGFNIWCTPDDHPQGWERVEMDTGAFSKPCEYVATATWGWEGESITHVRLTTDAYALSDLERGGRHHSKYRNRPEDIQWATAKVLWLFALAKVECPPIKIGDEAGGVI